MLILLSPAKKLLDFKQPYSWPVTHPVFQQKTDELAALMKTLSAADLARLMHLSPKLAALNYERFQAFALGNVPMEKAYPAVFLFQGDVYQHLKPTEWGSDTLEFASSRLLILSGLYGLLRPLDVIQPHRLEMGTALANSRGNHLYEFWKGTVTHELNRRLAAQTAPCLLNLASTEYFNVVDRALIRAPIVTIHFKEQNAGQLKVVGILAKKARGAMASYILQHRLEQVEAIKKVQILDYQCSEENSDDHNLTFIRSSTA